MSRYIAVVCAALVCTSTHVAASRPNDPALRLRIVEGRPIVSGVFVNGHGPYRFLVDTGTSLNMIDAKLARLAGLKPEFRTTVISATATTVMPGLQNAEVAVGSVCTARQEVLIGGLDEIHQLSTDIQGVLGQSFLSSFDYFIDIENSRLVFGSREAEGTRIPLRIVDGRPAVDTNLGRLLVDSGAHRLVLFNVPTMTGTYRLAALGGSADAGMILRELRIADRMVWRGEAVGVRSDEPGLAGLMPISLFKSIYVSNSQRFVQFN